MHRYSKIVLYAQVLPNCTLYDALLPLVFGRLWTLAVGAVFVTVVLIGTEKNDNARLTNRGYKYSSGNNKSRYFLMIGLCLDIGECIGSHNYFLWVNTSERRK